jgi:hypothetical protein
LLAHLWGVIFCMAFSDSNLSAVVSALYQLVQYAYIKLCCRCMPFDLYVLSMQELHEEDRLAAVVRGWRRATRHHIMMKIQVGCYTRSCDI